MKVYQLTDLELTGIINQAKDLLADRLAQTHPEAGRELLDLAVVLQEKNVLGKAWDYLFKRDNEYAIMVVVKKVPMGGNEE